MIVQILILTLILLAVPTVIGDIAARVDGEGALTGINLPFRWVSGQMILWAGFQLISVPMILADRTFQDLVFLFSGYTAALALLSVAVGIRRYAKKRQIVDPHAGRREKDMLALCLWVSVGVLLLVQLILAGLMAYEEGDDAFYVAISTITESSNSMYKILPYTGGTTGMDARHGLAPLPVWVAYLARLSGMRTVTVAQVALPMVLIVMSYAIYYLLGRRLFPDRGRKLPLFMLFLQVLVLFGGYSTYSAENFMLVRTAQGKSVLANIVIPYLLLLFLSMLEKLQTEGKTEFRIWLMVGITMIVGCLCSTQGTLLTCMFMGIVGLCAVVCYRRWRLLLPIAGCAIVPVCLAFLYFLME